MALWTITAVGGFEGKLEWDGTDGGRAHTIICDNTNGQYDITIDATWRNRDFNASIPVGEILTQSLPTPMQPIMIDESDEEGESWSWVQEQSAFTVYATRP